MIESLADRLHEPGGPHHGAPDKTAARRLATLEAAGRARVPFTTGILVGIGETPAERIDALVAIRDAHARHGHVQEVIVQNFLPKPGTAMHAAPACDPEEFVRTIATGAASCSAPRCTCRHRRTSPTPTASRDLIAAGIDDWGGVSPVTPDHVNPERPWPALDVLRAATERSGQHARAAPHRVPRVRARPRTSGCTPTCAPRCVTRPTSRASRATTPGSSGGDTAPPILLGIDRVDRPDRRDRRPGAAWPRRPRCSTACAPARPSTRPRSSRCSARAAPRSRAVAEVADQLRREIVGDDVTFVRNRNINYTNICTFKCRFCAFSKGPLSLNLRGDPYLLDLDEMQRRVRRGGRVRRDRGVPAGRHPPRLRRRLLPRRRPRGEGGRARHPRPRVHRARGHRGREAARHGPRRVPAPRRRKPGSRRCRAPRPRSSTTRSAPSSAPTRSTPRSGSTRTAPRTRSACGRTSRSCSARSSGPSTSPATCVRTRALQTRDRRVHRVRAAAVRAHGDADLPHGQGARAARRSARCC